MVQMMKRFGVGFVTVLFMIVCQNFQLSEGKAQMSTDASTIVFETNQGSIEIELWPDIAPKTCENMIGLIKKGYYDGITFHRVIKDFMLQGGDPTGTGAGGQSLWGGKFEDEVTQSVKFDREGLLAMANAGPNTNGSQFFITTVPTPWLNMRHTIFGEVVGGYDVVEKIENVKTAPGDRPVQEQKIIRAHLKK
jgi:peptidylprolyl isomerase